jgi:UDP-N-acetylmuramoyl-tripeptide--D-alanyl-D-alanine ligase
LNVSGRHNAANALAAAAVTIAAGVSFAAVCAGLESFAGARGRLQRKSGPAGCTVIDDTYNANPDSVRAAIDVLVATAGPSILVLGDMGEIGGASAQYHDEVGGYAKSQGVDRLFALGDASRQAVRNFGEGAAHFDNVEALVKALRPILISASVVLVKGSRFMRMERVVVALEALAAPATKKGGA